MNFLNKYKFFTIAVLMVVSQPTTSSCMNFLSGLKDKIWGKSVEIDLTNIDFNNNDNVPPLVNNVPDVNQNLQQVHNSEINVFNDIQKIAGNLVEGALKNAPHVPFLIPEVPIPLVDDLNLEWDDELEIPFFGTKVPNVFKKVLKPVGDVGLSVLNKIPGVGLVKNVAQGIGNVGKTIVSYKPRHLAAAGLKTLYPVYMANKEPTEEGQAKVLLENLLDVDFNKAGIDPLTLDLENLDDVEKVLDATPDIVEQMGKGQLLHHVGVSLPKIRAMANTVLGEGDENDEGVIETGAGWGKKIVTDVLKPIDEISKIWPEQGLDQNLFDDVNYFDPKLARRKYYVDILKKYCGQEENVDKGWIESLLSKQLTIPVYTAHGADIARSLACDLKDEDDNPLNIFGHNIAFQAAVNGHDLMKILFLWLQMEIEKKFFRDFQNYVIRSYIGRFDQRKELLVEAYKDAVCDPNNSDITKSIVEAFEKQFCVEKRYAMPLLSAVGFLIVLRWGLDTVEKNMAEKPGPNQLVNKLLDAFVVRHGVPLKQNDPHATIPVVIRPIPMIVAYIRSRFGLSPVLDAMGDARPFVMDLVRAQYSEGGWYNTLLGLMQTASEHQLFDMSKRLFMWFSAINTLYKHYDQDFKHYIRLHTHELVACVKNIGQEKQGTPEALIADKALKDFIAHACAHSSRDMITKKNRAYALMGQRIEWYLNLPIQIEIIKWGCNWVMSMM